jgi:hypothetical protein
LKRTTLTILAALYALRPKLEAATVTFAIDPDAGLAPIDPMSYGSNQSIIPEVPLVRLGGNRLTGYNWENNASNAGSDFNHSSDYFLLSSQGLPANSGQPPAAAILGFIDDARARNPAVDTIVTLQMAGYVSADANGTVQVSETAPGARWKQVVAERVAPLAPSPDPGDGAVYMDELVSYLVAKKGTAAAGGVKFYDLDNEPALWPSTHPRIHPDPPTYLELKNRSIALASSVTRVDPSAKVFGPVAYGWLEYVNLQNAPDSNAYPAYNNSNRVHFLNYYLDQMRQASNASGRRLLHYLDVHWYPEARGDNGGKSVRIIENDVSEGVQIARMQAPRSLWDPTYRESSWILSNLGGQPIALIPRLQTAISQFYPGTRLAITEWNYGAGGNVSGGIADADALGIFGKHGVAACFWSLAGGSSYVKAAYRLYLDYDGAGERFGNVSVSASASDTAWTSVYASRDDSRPSKLWVVALNKDYSRNADVEAELHLAAGSQISSIRAFRFDSTTSVLYASAAPVFAGSKFTDTLPFRSATMYEVSLASTSAGFQMPGDSNQDGEVDISDAFRLLLHLFGGGFAALPCEGRTAADPGEGDLALLDSNGDGRLDLADAVALLAFLFQAGAPPAMGTACVEITGCPDRCGG